MAKISIDLLDRALSVVLNHGCGSLFPEPPEIQILSSNWSLLQPQLASIDLSVYRGYDQIHAFAPKSRLNVRRASLLHPFDLILYTSLALREHIAAARLPANQVFSYRTEGADSDRIYAEAPRWADFREAARTRIEARAETFVGITDIADFYPRIYHHRLVNALEAATGPAEKGYITALEKMLARFSGGTSYGIPVGPPASRLFGEAVLIDVDSSLASYGIDFIRFVDDFIIFSSSPQGAEYGLRVLGETLFLNHGLTLNTAKTKLMPGPQYLERYLTLHSEKEENRRKLLDMFGNSLYESIAYEDLDDDLKAEVDAFNLSEMLTEALAEGENVDYNEVSFILKRLSALQKPELIPIVIQNLEKLYPVAESVAAFFSKFSKLGATIRSEISHALLAPMLNPPHARPSEYYSIWILSIFQENKEWNHAGDLLRIFRETNSDAIKRSAALALAVSGTRAQALAMKDYLNTGSSLSRTAMLLATAKLGNDERNYLRRGLRLSDPFEKLCAEASI